MSNVTATAEEQHPKILVSSYGLWHKREQKLLIAVYRTLKSQKCPCYELILSEGEVPFLGDYYFMHQLQEAGEDFDGDRGRGLSGEVNVGWYFHNFDPDDLLVVELNGVITPSPDYDRLGKDMRERGSKDNKLQVLLVEADRPA